MQRIKLTYKRWLVLAQREKNEIRLKEKQKRVLKKYG